LRLEGLARFGSGVSKRSSSTKTRRTLLVLPVAMR
jgi:hypothetical protein